MRKKEEEEEAAWKSSWAAGAEEGMFQNWLKGHQEVGGKHFPQTWKICEAAKHEVAPKGTAGAQRAVVMA